MPRAAAPHAVWTAPRPFGGGSIANLKRLPQSGQSIVTGSLLAEGFGRADEDRQSPLMHRAVRGDCAGPDWVRHRTVGASPCYRVRAIDAAARIFLLKVMRPSDCRGTDSGFAPAPARGRAAVVCAQHKFSERNVSAGTLPHEKR